MIYLSLNELKLVGKNRGIKDYENKSADHLIKINSESKTKICLSKKKIKEIKKKKNIDEQDINFAKPKIKKWESLYDIKNPKNIFILKIKNV